MSPQATPRQVMINTVAVLTVLFLAWLIVQIKSTLVLLLFGILFAAAIEPLVNRIRKRGISRGKSILLVYLGLIGVLALLVLAVVPPLVQQGSNLIDDIPNIIDNLEEEARKSRSEFIRNQGSRLAQDAHDAYARFRGGGQQIEQEQAVQFATSAFGVIFSIVTVLVVAFYWMTEKALVKRLVLGLFAIERRDRAHAMWDEIESRIGGWTRGQLTLMLFIGVISTIGYWALGLPFWLALGIFAGFTELIPFVGPFLGGAAATAVAITDSWQKAIAVVVFAVVLQQIESAFLVPRVMKNAVGMTPLTVILAVLVGGALAGVIGAILAIPVAAAAQVLVGELIRNRADDPDTRTRRAHPIRAPADSPRERDVRGDGRGDAAHPALPLPAEGDR